jgi:hypothetical protein
VSKLRPTNPKPVEMKRVQAVFPSAFQSGSFQFLRADSRWHFEHTILDLLGAIQALETASQVTPRNPMLVPIFSHNRCASTIRDKDH